MPLIAHAGLERAVLGREMHDYGNPLRLRRALDAGVRVVVAHCASMGEDRDLDKGENGPYVDSFSLFTRIFEKYEKHCYGDISAMTQVNRAGPVARESHRAHRLARAAAQRLGLSAAGRDADFFGGLPDKCRTAR